MVLIIIDEQFLLSQYVYARGLARDVDETVSSVRLHRLCATKQFLLIGLTGCGFNNGRGIVIAFYNNYAFNG